MNRVSDREYRLTGDLMQRDKEVARLKEDLSQWICIQKQYLDEIGCLERKIQHLEGEMMKRTKPHSKTKALH